jgi:16S rRNA (guanine527-N7)-methyltransferase
MRKPAVQTARDREDRNATGGGISFLSAPDRTDAAAARRARDALEELLAGEPALASGLPANFGDGVERYVALLLRANRDVNLTRVVEPAEVARLHLLDALAALPLLDAGAERVIDLGSGGGVPAIPLALARPATEWVMVDSVRKKSAILAGFIEALGLPNARVLAERAETLGRDPEHRERYGLVTARACAALPVLAELALPLLRTGGELVAWKGPLTADDDEVRRGRVAVGQLGGGRLRIEPAGPASLGGHTFVVVPKRTASAQRFPRRPGEPSRRPLG